jgi:hypothetical protein
MEGEMTAQINDSVVYQRKLYNLVGGTLPLFDPAQNGLTNLQAISTGCWLGYYCHFAVSRKRLRLKRVFAGLRHEDAELAALGKGPQLLGVLPVYDQQTSSWRYDLNQLIKYTGELILGADFVWSSMSSMGFASTMNYKKVLKLQLTSGVLDTVEDQSAMWENIRKNGVQTPGLSGLKFTF